MKTIIALTLMLASCGELPSKRMTLDQEERRCVNQCHEARRAGCGGPDPCEDFCLFHDGGLELMAAAHRVCIESGPAQ